MFPGFAAQSYVPLGDGGSGDFSDAAFETHILSVNNTKVFYEKRI